jgi:hypothetical protein
MKNANKLILSLLATCALTTSAMASDAAFTLEEAQDNCAVLKTITFTKVSPVTDGQGYFSGQNLSGVPFITWNSNNKNKYVMQPKDYPNSIDIQFEDRGGYGRKMGDVIVCYYYYTGFTGINVHSVMTTGHTK